MEGYATVVSAGSINVVNKKGQVIEIRTDRDYTSLVAIAAPVTVWYTTEGGVNRLEDIAYPASGSFVPANAVGFGIKRVIVLPQVTDVENGEGLVTAISAYLTEHAGWYVAPPELGKEAMERHKDWITAPSAADAQADPQKDLQAQSRRVKVLAAETRSDAVLEARIVKVKAKVHGSVASWDGITEPVASRATRYLSPLGPLAGEESVPAATADLSLWNRDGKLLWKKQRGFAVLAVESGLGATHHDRPLTEVYANHEAMQRWLATTLSDLAPPRPNASPSPAPPEVPHP